MMNNDETPELSGNEFDDFVRKGVVLIDFFAEWCMPCVMMSPIIEDLSEKMKGKVRFGKVNVEDSPSIAQKFNVNSIPNFVLFKDGKPVEQFVGALSEEEMEKRITKFL